MIPLQPLGQRVLVKRADSVRQTAGGLHLPDQAIDQDQRAMVLALGTAPHFSVAVGDMVLLAKYQGTPAAGDGQFIIPECDIMAILK